MKLASKTAIVTGAARGIGLAAPQIGQSLRVVVMDVEQNDDEEDVTEESREDRSTPAARRRTRAPPVLR